MGAVAAFREGLRRVAAAPLVVLAMSAVTLLVALPLSLALRAMLEAHLGRSLVADAVHAGTSYDWWQEFSGQAAGLGATFTPSIVGFAAVLENVSAFLDNLPVASTIAGVTAAWMVVWSFLSGGILDRFARIRATRAPGFFAACGMYFWRFMRLAVVAYLVYYVLFAYVHHWLLVDLYQGLTRDSTIERSAFLTRLALYGAFVALLAFCSLVLDYARIRIVVEDRRSALGGIAAGLRFVVRRASGTISLYVLNGMAFVLLVALYGVVAPGAPRSSLSMWLMLAVGQTYIVTRHFLKLAFYASQTAYFQGALAHAAYTAAPPVLWPDSPAAESIANGDQALLR